MKAVNVLLAAAQLNPDGVKPHRNNPSSCKKIAPAIPAEASTSKSAA